MNKYNLKTVPSGTTFKDYDNFDYMTNGELVDYNVNNIIFLNNGYTTILDLLSHLPDLTGYYTKDEIDVMVLNLQNEIDNVKVDSSDVRPDMNTGYAGINQYLDQVNRNETDIQSLENLSMENSVESSTSFIQIESLTTGGDPLRFDLFHPGGQTYDYVNIDYTPNTFTFLKTGKLSFNIYFRHLQNMGETISGVSMSMFKNGEENGVFFGSINPDNHYTNFNFTSVIDGIEGDVFYFTIQAINNAGEVVEILFEDTEDTSFITYFTPSTEDLVTSDELDSEIEILDDKITANTNDITTLNGVISANFETFGRYRIVGTTLADTQGEVRFDLTTDIALDSTYVVVTPSPNNFDNIFGGKITFDVIADGIINDDVVDLTITLRIYLNGEVVDTENKVVEAGKTVSINYANVLPVEAGDQAYATLEITDGVGSLSTVNPVIISINFNSAGDVSAVKTSQIINDVDTLPNNGINPTITSVNNINDNALLVNNSSGYNIGQTIALSESYRNFKYLSYRVGYNGYRLINTISSARINLNDNVVLYENTTLGFIVYLRFVTASNIQFLSSNELAMTDTFKFFVLEGTHRND